MGSIVLQCHACTSGGSSTNYALVSHSSCSPHDVRSCRPGSENSDAAQHGIPSRFTRGVHGSSSFPIIIPDCKLKPVRGSHVQSYTISARKRSAQKLRPAVGVESGMSQAGAEWVIRMSLRSVYELYLPHVTDAKHTCMVVRGIVSDPPCHGTGILQGPCKGTTPSGTRVVGAPPMLH